MGHKIEIDDFEDFVPQVVFAQDIHTDDDTTVSKTLKGVIILREKESSVIFTVTKETGDANKEVIFTGGYFKDALEAYNETKLD